MPRSTASSGGSRAASRGPSRAGPPRAGRGGRAGPRRRGRPGPPLEGGPARTAARRGPGVRCPEGTPPPWGGGAWAGAPWGNGVGVLYFAPRDTADAYLADGLTEEIILRLQQLPRLAVKS